MQVQEIMTKGCETCGFDSMVSDAAKLMANREIGFVPVSDDEKLVGILTDRDVAVRCVGRGLDPSATKVKDVMSRQVFYCFDDQSTEEIAGNMEELKIRRLPVVNRDKRLIGAVSLGDLSSRGAADEAGEVLSAISSSA